MVMIFINTKNSKTSRSQIFRLVLAGKLDLKNPNKNIALANLSICYTWKNTKFAFGNNKFKISPSMWNDKFDLFNSSYSISDIQDYFEYIIKKHETIADNPPI